MHDKQWTHQRQSVTAPGEKKQASNREPAHDAWRTKPAQKIDSRTLVHTVGGRVSSPWGATRDVAHPPVNAERAAGAKRTDGSPARGASATITLAGGPTGLTVACALSLGSRVHTPRNVPTLHIYLQECTSQSRIHLVFGFGAPGWGA